MGFAKPLVEGLEDRACCHFVIVMTVRPISSPIVRVVVVEDNEDDRELLVRQLRKSKIDEHVKFFSDGEEATAFLSRLPPPAPFCDLIAIFLDLKLPGMDGIDVLREIREIPRVQNTSVIIMTASLNPKDFEACQDLKVAAYIPKPVTFELFSKAITGLPRLPASVSGKLKMSTTN
jgi:CheY-like chemotaxis protein